jgi:hypothetical protein
MPTRCAVRPGSQVGPSEQDAQAPDAHIARAVVTGLLLLVVSVLAPVTAAAGAQPQPVVEEPGVSGYVLAPDGTPVSQPGDQSIARAVFA